MNEPQKDTQRALAAAKLIFDGRDPKIGMSSILVTLEQLVTTVLLTVMRKDARRAALLLNEGLVPGIEERLASYSSRKLDKEKGNKP